MIKIENALLDVLCQIDFLPKLMGGLLHLAYNNLAAVMYSDDIAEAFTLLFLKQGSFSNRHDDFCLLH